MVVIVPGTSPHNAWSEMLGRIGSLETGWKSFLYVSSLYLFNFFYYTHKKSSLSSLSLLACANVREDSGRIGGSREDSSLEFPGTGHSVQVDMGR